MNLDEGHDVPLIPELCGGAARCGVYWRVEQPRAQRHPRDGMEHIQRAAARRRLGTSWGQARGPRGLYGGAGVTFLQLPHSHSGFVLAEP